MRFVFYVRRRIPKLADPGDFIGLFLDGRGRPVVRYTEHPESVIERLVTYRDRLTPYEPSAASVNLLVRVMSGARIYPDPDHPPDLRLQ